MCVFDGVRVFSKHFALSLPSYHKFCFVSGQSRLPNFMLQSTTVHASCCQQPLMINHIHVYINTAAFAMRICSSVFFNDVYRGLRFHVFCTTGFMSFAP